MLCENICDSPKLNVWCGLFHDRDIGPFILEHSITGAVYLGMIENFVMRQIEDLNDDVIFSTTVHHHWSFNARYFLDQKMPGRWIGRDGPIPWPPRSPAIIPLDFFLWVDSVKALKEEDLTDLCLRIPSCIANITNIARRHLV